MIVLSVCKDFMGEKNALGKEMVLPNWTLLFQVLSFLGFFAKMALMSWLNVKAKNLGCLGTKREILQNKTKGYYGL